MAKIIREELIQKLLDGSRELYGQLVLYGEAGAATAFLNKIERACRRRYPERGIFRSSGRELFELFICGGEGTDENRLISELADYDLLLLDGVEFIAGKQETMRIFYRLFDRLHQKGGQIVIGADRHPSMMEGLDDRVLSQLAGALLVEV